MGVRGSAATSTNRRAIAEQQAPSSPYDVPSCEQEAAGCCAAPVCLMPRRQGATTTKIENATRSLSGDPWDAKTRPRRYHPSSRRDRATSVCRRIARFARPRTEIDRDRTHSARLGPGRHDKEHARKTDGRGSLSGWIARSSHPALDGRRRRVRATHAMDSGCTRRTQSTVHRCTHGHAFDNG